MTISQLLYGHLHGHTQNHQGGGALPNTEHGALSLLRRCLIWAAITLAASWVISSHVFAKEVTLAPETGMPEPGMPETEMGVPFDATTGLPRVPEPAPTQGAGCMSGPLYDYNGIFPPSCETTCAPACDVGPCGRYWFEADYLLWWTKGSRVVPLVSTGTIGAPGTEVLFGNDRYDLGSRSNFGFKTGMWFDEGRTFGVSADFFTLGNARESAAFSSNGETTLAQPYYNVDGAANASRIFAGTSGEYTYSGAMDPRQSEYFQSFALNFRINLGCNGCGGCGGGDCGGCDEGCTESCYDGCGSAGSTRAGIWAQRLRNRYRPDTWRLDFVTGWRTCRLNERTTLDATSARLDGLEYVNSWDSFKTQNEFHGGELGLLAQMYRGRWSLDILTKVGLGNQNQVVRTRGQTVITTGGVSTTYDGGLFALSSNIDHYDRDKFVAIPQIGLELGYQLSGHLRATFGYNFIYWANVVRSSEQINSQIDPDQIPPLSSTTATQPAFSWNDSDYWAQGINVGLEARF